MTTDGSKPADRSEGGLGFSDLSMNEIAPAVTDERSEAAAHTSRAWLLVILVVAVAAGLFYALRTAVDAPPSAAVQEQLRQSIAAAPYGQDGTVQGVSFQSGSKLQVDLTAMLMGSGDAEWRHPRSLLIDN